MTTYRVNPYRKTAVPTPAQLHVLNRMGCGYSRRTWRSMKKAGGASRWLRRQLTPARVRENEKARQLLAWFPTLTESPRRKWARHVNGAYPSWEYSRDLANYAMLRRVYSDRQLLESMVEFWADHLHVPSNDDLAWVHRFDYDEMLREHALGRFDVLLEAAALHPAMLLFLDNWRSVKGAPNENQGRELLELHTVGSDAGYTEDMVKDSAKILSGWTVDAFGSWRAHYDETRHTTGPVRVLGFTAGNGAADGRRVARDYLRYLAHHPATARNVATRLAQRFVSDTPSKALVDHLAAVFLESGTDVAATLRALVASREFRRSARQKVRTPVEDLVATCRVLGVSASRPRHKESFANALTWAHQSMVLYQWPRPDGPPDRNTAWASATRMLASFRMHWNLAGGYWPDGDVRYRRPASWLPQRRIRFDAYVDHLSRVVLGRPSTPRLLKAAAQATDVHPHEVVTAQHALASWKFVRLMAVLLDSPAHMSR